MLVIVEHACQSDLAWVRAEATGMAVVADLLVGWQPVAVRVAAPDGSLVVTVSVHLVGHAVSRRQVLCTAPLMGLDLLHRRGWTSVGRVYVLGRRAGRRLAPSLRRALVDQLLG